MLFFTYLLINFIINVPTNYKIKIGYFKIFSVHSFLIIIQFVTHHFKIVVLYYFGQNCIGKPSLNILNFPNGNIMSYIIYLRLDNQLKIKQYYIIIIL